MKVIISGFSLPSSGKAFNVQPDTTVDNLKKKITEETGATFDYWALTFAGRRITGRNNNNADKNKTLKNLHIGNNSRLFLTGRMGVKGGGTRKNRNRRNMTRRR